MMAGDTGAGGALGHRAHTTGTVDKATSLTSERWIALLPPEERIPGARKGAQDMKTIPMNSSESGLTCTVLGSPICVHVCMCGHEGVQVRVCVCACMCEHMWARACVHVCEHMCEAVCAYMCEHV